MLGKLTRERILGATTITATTVVKFRLWTKFQSRLVTVTFLQQDEFCEDDVGLGSPPLLHPTRIRPLRDSNVDVVGGGRRINGRGLALRKAKSLPRVRVSLVSTETPHGAVAPRANRRSVQIPIIYINSYNLWNQLNSYRRHRIIATTE